MFCSFNTSIFFQLIEKALEKTALSIELSRLLNDVDETMECLNRHPAIKGVFLKFNTPLSSSEPVERLFSYGLLIKGPKRLNLFDSHFE